MSRFPGSTSAGNPLALIAAALVALAFWTTIAGPARAQSPSCEVGPRAIAILNANSADHLSWSPFGRRETGWRIYEPAVAREIGSPCDAGTPQFAARLAAWQARNSLPASGLADLPTLMRMKLMWQSRRPFVNVSRTSCPPPPLESSLVRATPEESFGGKQILFRADAMVAYRRMIAAARAEVANSRQDNRLFTIFSAYRSPAYDAARCARDQNCQGIVRASCSAHRTATALDLFLGAAPGFSPDSSADANRLYLSRTAAYRWLVRNADRFGFANYAFEPWHWEFVGLRGAPTVQARL